MNKLRLTTAAIALAVSAAAIGLWTRSGEADPAAPQPVMQKAEAEHGEEGIRISPEAAREAGIAVTTLEARPVPAFIRAPGEVVPNRYRSGVVTPPIPGIVVQRLASVGERVRKGQPLAVLNSVDLAAAQADYQIAEQEWRRVRQLGKEIVSDKRFNETDIQRRQAMSRLLGFGMSPRDVAALVGAAPVSPPPMRGHFRPRPCAEA